MKTDIREKILVIAEPVDGKMPAFLFELVAAAERIRELFGKTEMDIAVLVPGLSPLTLAQEVNDRTGVVTLAVRWPCEVTPESLQQGLVHLVKEISPAFVILPQTTMGREVAPYLGAKLNGCTLSGVTDIQRHENRLVFYRLVMDNTRLLPLYPAQHGLCVLTLPPGTFASRKMESVSGQGSIVEMELPPSCLKPAIKRLSMTRQSMGNGEIQGAKIVVGAGRGIGKKENLKKIESFTARFAGACMGASRPLVDMGWVPYGRQVGITGATISPDLYIACGISGSSQHLAGMSGSKWVVSINKNPDAPICRHADLSIVADLNTFIEAFMESG
ncbi:electron transfer flavoprotein subunit alpha/FixB family protein [Desulfopila aestuarii]|uniref:Electron transfer flavoprotein alpha subunit apoprotein n=1 Tax=Desulfopila aestuarii DSM 18488 TaxID=1121416 RepID=A0A1M7Y6C8_9BACT|nr:electron transfer flavoprotein subunit alpha/FixB family protein [Desulfopila aestuarii]SHO48154.1 electron transfer flavoprotein alpha subunit apoprotein [Desulfopila aestuarii DSM 18488]